MQNIFDKQNLVETLKKGGVVVMPTDTIYGILGNAFLPETVERIYEIRKREKEKPCIILISDFSDLEKFKITISQKQKEEILKEGIRALTFILDAPNQDLNYLHRGTNSLAFRIPKDENLRNLLSLTGPLIAPSANIAGLNPAINTIEAKAYFGDLVDLYIDGGEIIGEPSKIIKFDQNNDIIIIRE